MKKFKKIVCLDYTRLTEPTFARLSDYSLEPVAIYQDSPKDEAEKLQRIGDADCVLVSWNTRIEASVIRRSPSLKYIGMCCSLISKASANVAIEAAEEQGIVVKGVRDYGDEGVVEFILAQLIVLAKGMGKQQWKPVQTELKGKVMGIVGLGAVGQMLAQAAVAFGIKVLYFSRTRKEELESEHIQYASLATLLSLSDVVTTHLPRGTKLMGEQEFSLMKPNSIFINTSVGPTFEVDALYNWLEKPENFAIFDFDGAFGMEHLDRYPNLLYFNKTSGMTDAAFDRLSSKVMDNLLTFLDSEGEV